MKNYLRKKTKGFTIIEVLIVLAIAGLIMSIVFIAVPQLQRNARDNRRQAMANNLSTELGSFAANNQGTYPWAGVNGTWTSCATSNATKQSCYDWYNRYVSGGKVNLTDPKDGGATTISFAGGAALPAWAADNAWITVGTTCSGDQPASNGSATASSKQFALVVALERSNTYYCVDNG